MPSPAVPQREPINEIIRGTVSRLDDSFVLSPGPLPQAETIAAGELIVRYGIPYMGKAHLSIVPDLVVADHGEMLSGETAWAFLMQSSHLFPRSDVLGFRNDGDDEMLALKHLDFDSPYNVFAYRQPSDHHPFVKLTALVTIDRAQFPERLYRHLRCFDSLDDWRRHG